MKRHLPLPPRGVRPTLQLLLLVLTVGCATSGSEAAGELRVLTWNIHHGEGQDGVFDLERIAASIVALRPDFVALQEVDVGTGRAGGVDQVAELARLTGMRGGFARAMAYDGGGYGEGWLSRWPVLESRNLPLPVQPGREPRAVAAVTVLTPHGPVTFLATHLDHVADPGLREAQARALATLRGDLLLGDLNATPDTPAIAALAPTWDLARVPGTGPTYPSDVPERRIDYVLPATSGAWRVLALQVLDEPIASDHAPVLARVRRVSAD